MRSFDAPRAALVALTLATIGPLIGSGLAQIAAARLLVLTGTPLPLRLPRAAAYSAPEVHDGLFAPDPPGPPDARPAPRSACDPSWRLVGAAFFPSAPERSLAALHTPSGGAVLGLADQRDAWTLVEVDPEHAALHDTDGRECRLSMYEERGELVPAASPAAARSPSTLIEPLGENRFRVAHGAIEQASAEPPLRLVPRIDENGAAMRVYGVRPHSLVHQAGIENGDVVTAIDGQPPTSGSGLDAYARAIRGEPVRISVERRGRSLELHYEPSP